MLLAIATDGSDVAGHFGHCEVFTIFNTDTGGYSLLRSPEHQPGALPLFLKDNGAEIVISGGMGERARTLLESVGIQVYTGVNMSVRQAVDLFVSNRLSSSGEFCAPHDHGIGCGHEHGHGNGTGCGTRE